MNPNNFGRIFLTDQCQKIEMKDFLREAKHDLKKMLLESEIKANDVQVSIRTAKTGNGGERWFFECPVCKRRCTVLFQHPISILLGCRSCLNLKYRKCAKKGMVELDPIDIGKTSKINQY